MAAALQNYSISQGATLASQLTVQVAWVPITITGTTTVASQTVTIATDSIAVGMSISGPGIQANTIVTQILGPGSITISQLATLSGSNPLALGAWIAIDLSSVTFLFSTKAAIPPANATQAQAFALPDSSSIAQGVYEFNWTETSAPTVGQTWLTIPDTVTQQMAVGTWWYIVRVVGPSGSASDLMAGVINITQPPSTRFS